MTYQTYISTLICLWSCSVFLVISADLACDKSKCKGPIAYYEELQCTPTYSSDDSCCPVKYNCDHLKERSKDKCYFRGEVYERNQSLREEDAEPCDIGCTCLDFNEVAQFSCAVVDCFSRPTKPGCYRKNSPYNCCPGEEVCPENPEDRARCEVDGNLYRDGEHFTPSSDPTLSCNCAEGYTGENVAPFCRQTRLYNCGAELRGAADISNNCAPAYYSTQNPATDCSIFSRCQNQDDRVVESAGNSTETAVSDPDSICTFGNLTMKIGDQLNQGTDYSSVCLKCVCEVPPLPTCLRRPDSECDDTAHAPFDHFAK